MWSCGKLGGGGSRLGVDVDTGGDFGSVIDRVVNRRWFGLTVMWGGRCSCASA